MRISELKSRICKTLEGPVPEPEVVLSACQRVSEKLARGDYRLLLEETGRAGSVSARELEEAVVMLSRDYLSARLVLELGVDLERGDSFPLGVLFHIGAGNLDGLSAYSVVEGLLAGNINLLKLPAGEQGVSAFLLRELIRMEPSLQNYIYVFDVPSSNQKRMRQLMELSDAVVLWGGDEAVLSVRSLAPPNTRLIEWGHKLSFAYVTETGLGKEAELLDLARHMIETGQTLCSSCQGIYLDTDRIDLVKQFSKRFLSVLRQAYDEAAREKGAPDMGVTARNTLRVQEARMSAMMNSDSAESAVVYGDGCVSVTASSDCDLTLSLLYGNCWVKPLPRAEIISALHEQKSHLQTVGLLCGEDEREALAYLLCRAGAVRICDGGSMSKLHTPGAHDGEYPLRRYRRIITKG